MRPASETSLLFCLLIVVGCQSKSATNSSAQSASAETTNNEHPTAMTEAVFDDDFDDGKYKDVPERYRFIYNGSLTKKKVEATQAAFPYKEIQLERTECFGPCPIYTVSFRSDGTAIYIGREHVSKLGKHQGVIDIFSYARLCYAIEKSKLLDERREFSANGTDMSTRILRVTFRGSDAPTVISDYGDVGPIELWLIFTVIDRLADTIKWQEAAP